jgi:hypothetical protein
VRSGSVSTVRPPIQWLMVRMGSPFAGLWPYR